jgi:hypothetical protein
MLTMQAEGWEIFTCHNTNLQLLLAEAGQDNAVPSLDAGTAIPSAMHGNTLRPRPGLLWRAAAEIYCVYTPALSTICVFPVSRHHSTRPFNVRGVDEPAVPFASCTGSVNSNH